MFPSNVNINYLEMINNYYYLILYRFATIWQNNAKLKRKGKNK